MKTLLAALGLLVSTEAATAQSHPFWGQWQPRYPENPGFVGVILIDREGRATWDSPTDPKTPYRFFGYVAENDGVRFRIAFTDRRSVAQVQCVIQASELLQCQTSRQNGTVSFPYALVRVGPGPDRLQAPTPPSR